MNKKQAINFIDAVIHQLFNHGWAEDYQYHMEYNDSEKVQRVIELAVEGDGEALSKYIDNESWDEEANWQYDDGGLVSFAQEIGKLMRKYKVLEEDKKQPLKDAVKVSKNVSYRYTCPHCGAKGNTEDPSAVDSCDHCENPISVTFV